MRYRYGLAAVLVGGALALASGTAAARDNVTFGLSVGVPAYSAPAYGYAPPPPYYAPPPRVVYYGDPYYYGPRYYGPGVTYRYYDRHDRRYWDHRRDWR